MYWLIEGPPRTGDNWRSRTLVPGGGYGMRLDEVADFHWGEEGRWWREPVVQEAAE
jgi:hypothetical protein